MPLIDLIASVVEDVATTVIHTWPYLVLGILSAAALKVYVGTDRIAVLFRQRTGLAVTGSVAAAVATPFCSCGTTAVVLSMLASAVPWAPVVAFMVASPLTSPDGLFVSAGFFGWPFATFFVASSVILGFAGGAVAYGAERAGLLRDQARFATPEPSRARARALPVMAGPVMAGVGPGAAHVSEFPVADPWRLREFTGEVVTFSRRMVVLFLGFTIIGYTAIAIIPTAWLTTLLGGSSPLSVPLAATLGVPFYFSSEANLPLIASLVDGGMGQGAAMAFLITGAGTSIGAMSGALLIARWRVIAIIIGTLWVGAIVLGLAASIIL
jgi:uncharacterized membrane protein YraQ (UPF0718 family)